MCMHVLVCMCMPSDHDAGSVCVRCASGMAHACECSCHRLCNLGGTSKCVVEVLSFAALCKHACGTTHEAAVSSNRKRMLAVPYSPAGGIDVPLDGSCRHVERAVAVRDVYVVGDAPEDGQAERCICQRHTRCQRCSATRARCALKVGDRREGPNLKRDVVHGGSIYNTSTCEGCIRWQQQGNLRIPRLRSKPELNTSQQPIHCFLRAHRSPQSAAGSREQAAGGLEQVNHWRSPRRHGLCARPRSCCQT